MRKNLLVLIASCVLAGLGCGGGGGPKGPKDLTVMRSPEGKVEGPVRVILAFSEPMVSRDKVDKPARSVPVSISPEFPREARWTDERTLVISPTQSLPVSTKFVARIPGDTSSLDGSHLGETETFEFFTERLTGVIELLGDNARAARDPIVKLTFNHEVPFDHVTRHCGFDGAGKHHAVKLAPESSEGPAKSYAIKPAAELGRDTEWVVSCKPELRGAGNLGLEDTLEEQFQTFGALEFVSLEPDGNDVVPDEDTRLELAFSNPIAEPYQMKLTPAVQGFPDRCHALSDTQPGLSCAVQLDAHTSYTLVIEATQKDGFGQALGQPHTQSFRTTDATPTISVESGYFVAELVRPVLPVWTRNVKELDIRVVDVTPATFHKLQPLLQWWEQAPADFSGSRLVPRDKKLAITGEKNKWGQRPIDPAELLGKKPGSGMYYLEIGSKEVTGGSFDDGGREKVLVNFTDIGVVSKLSPTRGLVWVTQLSTGKPLSGANVTVRDGRGKQTWAGTTDADGVAVLPGTDKIDGAGAPAAAAPDDEGEDDGESEGEGESEGGSEMRIFVASGTDWTMINPTRSGGLSPWSFNVSVDGDRAPTKLRGFMHTDRGLYRAGEKVHVKGLARVTRLGEPLAIPGEGKTVKVTVDGPQGKTFVETEAKLSAYGGFWFDLDLPEDARLGDYMIRATLEHGTFTREFSVEAYRPATFEVTGKAKAQRVVRRGNLEATIAANYLYGAPLGSGDVEVAVHSRPRRVEFEEHEGFEFRDERRYDSYYHDDSEDSQQLVTEQQSALDATGNASLSVPVSPDDIYTDADLLIRASVTSPANEVISKSFTVSYFRSRKYFGIKSPGYFLEVKKPAKFEVVAVTPNAKVVDGPAKVTVTRRDWNCVWEDWGYRGSYQCKDTTKTIVDQTVQIAGGKAAVIEFTPETGGEYVVLVEGATDKDEAAVAATRIYAWGDGGGSWRSDDTLQMEIVSDKKEYKAGDTATIVMKTDLSEATGLVTIERDGVIEKRIIQVTPTAKYLTVPITANYAPNVYVSVALVQKRMSDGPRGKPRMRMGLVNLPVRPADNTLKVAVETDRKDYRPGAEVTATIKVTDQTGTPVAAEVSITAADEGVLSLIGFETPNPVPTFYAPWGLGVSTATQLEFIRDIPGPNVERPATGGDAPGTMRSRFVSTAVWAPGAVTNANGVATVKFAAPDNLTAFRIMAVAADKGYRFGSGDKRFTVSKPVQLHQALPRFLNAGDELQGGVVVHNETGKAGAATVKLVADHRLTVKGGAERTVQVPKGGRVPVLFDLAGSAIGETALRFSVALNGEADAVEFKLPVQHPSPVRVTTVAQGVAKGATTVPVTLPADAIAGSAELVVSVDRDGLAGIEEGLRELVGYPYGCLEQTTSKVIPMIAARDLAESLAIDGLAGTKLDGYVKAGIAKIGRHQTAYGGFSLWPGGEPETYYTAYALWGLYLAKQAGYTVDQSRIADGLEYLRGDGQRPSTDRPYYSEAGNLGAQAFALYVRAVLGDKDPQAATTLIANAELPVYGKAYLARALAAGTSPKDPAVVKLVRELADLAAAPAQSDKLITEPEDDEMEWYMSSSLRTSSAVLSALVELDPRNEAIEPLVRAIMKNRRTERYFDTQENLYSLLALTSYARSVGGQTRSVTVKLGAHSLIAGALAGKQRMRVATMPLSAGGALAIEPTGEVHYSVQIRHRNAMASLKAESNGLVFQREYLDQNGQPKTTFVVGDIVVVRLTTQLADDANHMMVSDPMPAGFEALNTKLATVGIVGIDQTEDWGTYREMYDDRVDFASEWSSRGDYVHQYTMRAIAAGKFARPPARAELMYEPEVNGRSGLDVIEVKAK